MAKKKTTTSKRKTTTRRKKADAVEQSTDAAEQIAVDPDASKETAAPAKPRTSRSRKTTTKTKRKKTAKRTKKKITAADSNTQLNEPGDSIEPAVVETEVEQASAGKITPKTKKRKSRKRGQARTAKASADISIKPISPTAEVEQSEDTIVIRFPSASAPTTDKKSRSDQVDEIPRKPGDTTDQVVPNGINLEPPIDWEATEAPQVDSPQPDEAPDSESEAAPIDITDDRTADDQKSVSESKIDEAETTSRRSRRRRRRKKKDPNAPTVTDTTPEKEPEPEEESGRPEPADEDDQVADPAAEEKPARRRRRRSRRGKGKGEAQEAEPAQAAEPVAEPAEGLKEMIINVVPREECRIAIMEEGKLQEIYLERASSENHVGNIYKGVITNVEPSIQAAFIDFGQGKNGFLHISDLHPEYFPEGSGNIENVGRKMPRRNRPPIQRCLRRGQQLLVQITKEGIGTKGPTLTTYLSIPGRFLVMMPGMRQLGVSRKIEDDESRRKLRDTLNELSLPDHAGFIARTAAMDRTKRELQSDLNYLSRLWKSVDKRIKNLKAPAEIYTESDLVIRTIRDVYTSDIGRIIVDDESVAERAQEFLSIFSPRSRDTVVHYQKPEPIFHLYGIEAELERLHSRFVPLKSGGSLVIDQTEALVAIDVNSGRFRTEDDAETTAYMMDLEAADEIPRQLRLRDLGGVVICDFIDVRMEKHKREIERRLNRNLKEHKERAKVLRMSEFGIIELTRQRQRASLTRNVYQDCRHCHGTGLVKTAESVAFDVMRLIQLAVTKENNRSIEVCVSTEVAFLLQNRKRAVLHELETENQRSISIKTESEFGLDQIEIKCYDQRGRLASQS